jgi:cysteine synthase
MPVAKTIADLIGKTPLIRFDHFSRAHGVDLFGKLEGCNPGGSVKDRIALAMIEDAERAGRLRSGSTIVEPTSGNTGIALAMLAAARGYRLIVTMPEAMSPERQMLLRSYGADVLLTPGSLMKAAVEQAELLGATIRGAVLLRQFENPANPAVHEQTTAEELWGDTDGALDVFVAGVGTGGTISGVARAWKRRRPLHVVAVEPKQAAVLSGGEAGQHGIQGLGAGFIPRVLDRSLVDEVIAIDEPAAIEVARRLAREEGVFVGISSAAALAAALSVAARPERRGQRIAVMLPDFGERYLHSGYARALGGRG